MMQSKELQISLMDSVKVLNADLFYWRSNLIEVPGMEHEHHHGHTHGYQPLAHLTPEMVLDIQKDLRNQIIQLNIRTQKLLDTLIYLRDLGNTVIVVEHDEDAIRQADYVIDIGPGAGIHGGQIVASGSPNEEIANTKSFEIKTQLKFQEKIILEHIANIKKLKKENSEARRRNYEKEYGEDTIFF